MAGSNRKNNSSDRSSPSKQSEKVDPSHDEPESSDNESSQEEDQAVPVQVNNACLSELKNALDDTLKSYLTTKAGFQQDYFCDDVKLTLGWVSNIIAAGISLAGWYIGWEKTQGYTLYCVIAYVILSTILSIFTSTMEKNKVFVGTKASNGNTGSPDKLTISVEVKAYEPIYRMELVYETAKKTGVKKYAANLKPEFKRFFDVDGILDESAWNKYLEDALKTAVSKS